jgi:hypothetical protein
MPEKVYLEMLDVTSREDGKAGLRVKIRITKVKERSFLWFKRKPITSRRILIADNWHSRTGHFHFSKWDYSETRGNMPYDDGYCHLVTMPTEQFPFYPIKRDRIRQLIDEWFEKNGLHLDGEWKD